MPFFGSASAETSGMERVGESVKPFWYEGLLKKPLTPNPPAPVGGVSFKPFQNVSPPYVTLGPNVSDVPPTAVPCGQLAGRLATLLLPSMQVLPKSPVELSTVMPAAAALARTESILWASARVAWTSQ